VATPDAMTTMAVYTPSAAVTRHNASIVLGNAELTDADWWRPGAAVPQGAFAMVRGDAEAVELVSDPTASRSLWYIQTDDKLIASTSQRAIIALLGSYQPNTAAYPWVLSAGCLGPDQAWDRRIRKLPPAAQVSLDRRTWRLSERAEPIVFAVDRASDAEHERRLREALIATYEGLKLDFDSWVVALSGGVDSRCSLVLSQRHAAAGRPLHCITWGTAASRDVPGSDAAIARQLCEKYGHSFRFFEMDAADEPAERILDRVLMAGEGRTGYSGGSTDGFRRYKEMSEAGIVGLIRSDEALGWTRVKDEADVRQSLSLDLVDDFRDLRGLDLQQLGVQELPDSLHRRQGEALAEWRDRLYQQFRIPCVLSGLSDGRLSYLEQANPLICQRIFAVVRRMPEHLRTDKSLFRKIVRDLEPDIPFAKRGAIVAREDVMADAAVREVIGAALASAEARSLLPRKLLDVALGATRAGGEGTASPRRNLASAGRQFLSSSAKSRLRTLARRWQVRSLGQRHIALRAFQVVRMHHILNEDAQWLARRPEGSRSPVADGRQGDRLPV
jgi:hypothetical protein